MTLGVVAPPTKRTPVAEVTDEAGELEAGGSLAGSWGWWRLAGEPGQTGLGWLK